MKNFLINSLGKPQTHQAEYSETAGPVVTISRECGCSANRIAIKLSKILTGYSYHTEIKSGIEWKWMNKEVIEHAARELEMQPKKIRDAFMGEVKMNIHDVTHAFSTTKIYDSDNQNVIDTVAGIIYQLAAKGHCIIIGRGAGIVASNIHNRLSIKLQAPPDWRIKRIMEISNLNYSDAHDYMLEVDHQRSLFVEHLAGRKVDNNDFDVVFNYATLTDDQIVDAIINIMKNKGLI
jgi:cytidylate kinase